MSREVLLQKLQGKKKKERKRQDSLPSTKFAFPCNFIIVLQINKFYRNRFIIDLNPPILAKKNYVNPSSPHPLTSRR